MVLHVFSLLFPSVIAWFSCVFNINETRDVLCVELGVILVPLSENYLKKNDLCTLGKAS